MSKVLEAKQAVVGEITDKLKAAVYCCCCRLPRFKCK